jgi:hypothetical protein
MVEALYIAATQDNETAVADYLEDQLTGGTLSLNGLRQHFRGGGRDRHPPIDLPPTSPE